jgi:SAM-dependent methyltransferase
MTQLYVSGLTPDIDEPTLRGYFNAIGAIELPEIIRDLDTGESRGYAVVRTAEEQADKVINKIESNKLKDVVIQATRMPLTLPGEMAVRDWFQRHPESVLRAIGIKQGDKVLDYGCGPGIFTIVCAQIIGNSGKVFALDVRARALEQVRNKATGTGIKNIETILQTGDNISIPLPYSSLDVVCIFDVMHDIKDKSGLMKEVYRVLKVDGFLSVFPMHWGNESLLKLVSEQRILKLRDNYVPRNGKSPSTVLNFVKSQ